MVKLFVSDLDGTLLNRNFRISDANRDAISLLNANGIRFVVATGRIHHDAYTICRNFGLSPYIIANNGACVFDEEGSQIYGRWITPPDLKAIITFFNENRICYGIGTSEEYLAPPDWQAVLDSEARRLLTLGRQVPQKKLDFTKYETTAQNGFRVMDIMNKINEEHLTCYSISVVTHDEEAIQKTVAFVDRLENITTTVSGSHNMEIISKGGTKGNALGYLADLLDIRPDDIAAIGDSFNDLSMLQYAGISIAMGNADDKLKAACTHCTTSCMEDGFAAAVKNLLQEQGVK